MNEEVKTTQEEPSGQQPGAGGAPAFDYEKLAGILAGRTAATEDSVLKGYFKQQGITGEEAAQAIADFKAQKAAKTPDPAALRQQAAQADARALEAETQSHALLMAAELSVDIKVMPYVLRMADLSGIAADGKVDDGKLKEALEKVLTDLPQLKSKTEPEANKTGFRVGTTPSGTAGGVGNDGKPVSMRDAIAARIAASQNK